MRELKPDLIYTREEAQEVLRVSRATIGKLLTSRALAAAKVGRDWRIQGRDILAYLEAGKEIQHGTRTSDETL